MIQRLALRYSKTIACFLLTLFYASVVLPLYGSMKALAAFNQTYMQSHNAYSKSNRAAQKNYSKQGYTALPVSAAGSAVAPPRPEEEFIDGPHQPEMTSFKSIGTDNMVNLFTGSFSYNIPLMDVGGYPVNIYYDGDAGMEQQASWVGLGWNINPGNVSRNMRGIPDDFNGEEMEVHKQNMKPNITWGVRAGSDLELFGIKSIGFSVSGSLGVSVNNYLGPALDLNFKGSASYNLMSKSLSEKTGGDSLSLGLGVGLDAGLSSRSGLTLSPSVSLTSNAFHKNQTLNAGLGASTSYNSRSGISQIQLTEQMSLSKYERSAKQDQKEEDVMSSIVTHMGINPLSVHMSTPITFARPSYTPTMRMPVTNEAYSGHFQSGSGMFGLAVSLDLEVYKQSAKVSSQDMTQTKPMVGYMYYQNAVDNTNAIMDFTRFNDREVTPHTPIISAPQYSYDVFSIQGEGTGGSIRAYRNDLGYVKDNTVTSKESSIGVGADLQPGGHYGGNVDVVTTPSTIGDWNNSNKLKSSVRFGSSDGVYESVYFRNPGEKSVLAANQFNNIGGTDLVRVKLGGTGSSPGIEPTLERFTKDYTSNGTVGMTTDVNRDRKKRTQVISFLTAAEAAAYGLDKQILSYAVARDNSTGNYIPQFTAANLLQNTAIDRVSLYRKAHHISQINVTEQSGQRYVYGIPVYNLVQKDFTFSMDQHNADADTAAITNKDFLTTSSPLTASSSDVDGYVQSKETPAYAHSFLLSGLLSPDYVDITGDGISDDDMGTAVKFNYTRVQQNADWAVHKWRTPLTTGNYANFNGGNHSETKDDKGLVSYGEREMWYVHSIESKTMIALFTLGDRADGKGTRDEYGGVDGSDSSVKCLKRIDLYNKADLKQNGLAKAKPVKSVFFSYSYQLCNHTPDNPSGGGKLTLDSIYFTFNGQARTVKNRYVFSYINNGKGNPDYAFNGSDRWGTYKPVSANPQTMRNVNYPYTLQDSASKSLDDEYAGAWSLKKILLPSGGQLEVNYEADDYAYVQNKRAMDMMQIAGMGKDATAYSPYLYGLSGVGGIVDYNYLFIKVPDACTSKADVLAKYLDGVSQLAVKMQVYMPKGSEFLTSYFTVADYGVMDKNPNIIWIQMNTVGGMSPLSVTAIEYLREELPGQVFPGYDVSGESTIQQVGSMLVGMLSGLASAFTNIVNYLRLSGYARGIDVTRSFVRLNDPDGFKYGGGQRVKSVLLKDNWKAMTGQYTSVYGQQYDYTTTETFNGAVRTISSGVASYEPSLGGEENPFQYMVQVSNKLPLGPVSYGAIEMPVLDAFFPSPVVGYSKVTVKAVNNVLGSDTVHKSRSGVGKQVTEYYTAKDYPVYVANTALDPLSDLQSHSKSDLLFFYKYNYDYRALSQGFLVATNDMHGQMKSQSSYAETDSNSRIAYSEFFYRNTGDKGLGEQFDFVSAAQGGTVSKGNMGIDIELMTDAREFQTKGGSTELQGQADLIPLLIPIWIPTIWPVIGKSENTYRAVTTTKVINYHSIADSTVVMDKGSVVSTKNLVYDAETGDVVLTRTSNMYNQPVYKTSYPAYWAYSGMGLAYKNIDAVYPNITFNDGKITGGSIDTTIIESGDELFITNPGTAPTGVCAAVSASTVARVWAFNAYRNNTSLAAGSNLVFIDSIGNTYTRSGVSIKIIRSGRRNMITASLGEITGMQNPVIALSSSVNKLMPDSLGKVLNATAVEFREKWQTDNDIIKKYSSYTDTSTCITTEIIDCGGYLEKKINPYVKGLIGNYRPFRSMVFYGNRSDSFAASATNLPANGYLANFKYYWRYNAANHVMPDSVNTQWVWNTQITKVNAKGQEMENRNALNIYTSAQYGYSKSLPVAITNNARLYEMGYAGFEDSLYSESLDADHVYKCTVPHFDLTGMSNAALVNTDGLSFAAHTGKYALAVAGNATAAKSFNVSTGMLDSFTLKFGKDTAKVLANIGNNVAVTAKSPTTLAIDTFVTNSPTQVIFNYTAQWGEDIPVTQSHTGAYTRTITYNGSVYDYVNITTGGTYEVYKYTDYNGSEMTLSATLTMYDINGQAVTLTPSRTTGAASGGLTTYYKVCLQAGIYKMQMVLGGYELYTCTGTTSAATLACADVWPHLTPNYYKMGFSGTEPTTYKNVTTTNGCITAVPAAADSSMLNPTFTVPAGKRMVFSSWVKQDTATSSKVRLSFSDGSYQDIVASGPVIDGWQRVSIDDGFIVPAAATTMTVNFINSSGNTIYYDDVRLHPFNANMKSYVYDPVTLRLMAELDANNYATFYEYDAEGTLIRTKAETVEGIKTITETRSAKQKKITAIQ